MNEKPKALTPKCKTTNKLGELLYFLIFAVTTIMGNLIPAVTLANNSTPFSVSEISINNHNFIELPIIMRSKVSDVGYLLRDNIKVLSGNGVTVNAGPDQNLSAGTIQASLAGVMTGGSGSAGTVNLVVIFGESNASGEAPNSA